MNRNIRLFVLFLSFITTHSAMALVNRSVTERIRPVGKVRIEDSHNTNVGVAVAAPVSAVAATTVSTQNGQAIYGQYCTVCHQQGLAGAPRFRSEDWKPRLSGRGIEALLASALQGINAMPPRGTCVKCSDDELRQAIEYMLPRK